MKENCHVTLVGPLPPPIGGVSSHILGLAKLLASRSVSCTIIDGYPASDEKVQMPGVSHIVFKGRLRFAKIWWFLFPYPRKEAGIVHFHFSTMVGLLLVFPVSLIKGKGRFFITIHNGDQRAVFEAATWPWRAFARAVIGQMDKVIALSQRQLEFYLSIGIAPSKIELWSSPPPLETGRCESSLPAELQTLQPVEDGGTDSVLMTSGYPSEGYLFEYCIQLFEEIASSHPCQLIVCLYGVARDTHYEAALRARLAGHSNIHVIGPLPVEGFNALLSKASIYLRPSKVDSFGLAITAALNQGVPCVASDICGRDRRCVTYPASNYLAFKQRSLEIIEEGRRTRTRKKIEQIAESEFDQILDSYQVHKKAEIA